MTTSLTLVISIGGIFYSIIVGIYSVSNQHAESIDSIYQHAFDDLFVVLNTGISVIAWLLFLSTAGTTTPLVATLFILAEAVFVIKESINIALFYWYGSPMVNPHVNPTTRHHQMLNAIEFKAIEEMAWVNLVAAVGLTSLIAGWCLAPESLVVGALSLIAMGTVYWVRNDAIQQIKVTMKTTLQKTVDEEIPWWIGVHEPRMKSSVQVDLKASNVGLRGMDPCEDWHHRDAPVSRVASQAGLFNRKLDYNRAGNDSCVSDNQRNHQSAMMG